ncbi:helix-hairpin-helix domain-containing protein [Aquimarina celericrescens]|uniref:Helix-hairpin-helix domain-containing protein n=1 Tax=Aquimarina celericrescens TaxID=1964542 RepID=A0ABW5AVM0_9FLAO|nr:helix-hairpin-helix domain-containing protein [Aquimarina celericrescens]
MNTIKSHFEMHLRFRNGIFLLVLVLLSSILIFVFYPYSKETPHNLVELTEFQNQIDSLKRIAAIEKEEVKLKLFNPNFISDHKGYQLGLSVEELDRLIAFRNEGKWINSVSDFKKVTKVSDSLLEVISPLFKFPEWVKNKSVIKKDLKKKYMVKSYDQKEDLNEITLELLRKELNVPDFVAEKIIKYRNEIGGFISDIQLKDISVLYENQRKKILSRCTVKTPREVKKVNINKASVKELLEVPYFDFEIALEIKDLVENSGSISNFDELGKINGFSLEKIDRIALYLTLK